ncbi:MAG: response regulator [Bacteroidales bacterium]|nr:response regulator [Bacteroidales bacterium]
MDKKQEAFLLELLNDFKIEASEHHQAIINGLIALEKNPLLPVAQPLIETTFREIHSLKGAARAVNQLEIERLCQTMESVFHKVKDGVLPLSSAHFDILYQATDMLDIMLREVENKEKSITANMLSQMMKRLEMIIMGKMSPQPMDFPTPPPPPNREQKMPEIVSEQVPVTLPISEPKEIQYASKDTVRITTAKLGTLLREAEEFISVKATLGYYIREIQKQQNQKISAILREMDQFHRSVSRMIDDLLLDIKTTLLYPFSTLLEIVPKIVRDLGKEYNKEINLIIQGGEIEIDRRILEELKDPMIHLIRNCIDHGIETQQVRKKAGKSSAGILEIKIRQESGNHVVLSIHDDGAGIDREKVVQSAIKMGILRKEAAEKMTDREVNGLIFRSGISTSPFITDISGRGLGMAIVGEKVAKLGGNIAIVSVPGQGTTFLITLPVTISNFRGILVKVNESFFIIPTTGVERAIRISKNEIQTVESKQILLLNNESVALVKLGDVLGIPSRKGKKNEEIPLQVLILSMGQKRIGFIIDEVHGEQEGMIKDMGPQLVHVKNITGVTLLGNGQVIPILNIDELMESATRISIVQPAEEISGEEEAIEHHQKYILVAEDSITLRLLLKNIIESDGYLVKTAIDGMDAFQLLKNEVFDLVVSDVEMPRMNGFELTAKIRKDKTLTETPVILVTALDTAEDRQRGMESGANAYIVKGSFEQSNLLETIHRLI